ncbi:hypothetical protein L3Y34_016556 [Caenorhabditis briggsae]|uniref:Serpentine Receptor, class I n=1 Tax=Caenorhabditis briggsae TaxID=6238 RepID=A0AAE9DYL8_CAEBR|nr:hypothetical protein L3Y34_016556 [Caenorhabditis briggsae]
MPSATWQCPAGPPNYYLTILHFIGFFSVPINFLCIYLVWFYTPKDSKFRYCLLYVQIVAFFVEIDMSWVCPGYYLFPMMGGYNIAITSKIFSGHQNTVFGAFKFCFELPSLLLCFIYRQNAAADLDQKFKLNRYFISSVIATCHTFPFVIAFCLLESGLSHQEMLKIVATDWPKCMHVFENEGFVIYDPSGNFWSAAVGVAALAYISIFSLFGAFLGIHTMYILQKVRFHLSRQTYAVHRTAMINLGLQSLIPTVCIIIPFNFIFLVVYNDWWQFQEIATNTLFVMAAHSMVSSTVLILSNRRFRSLIVEKFENFSKPFLYTIPMEATTVRISPNTTILPRN